MTSQLLVLDDKDSRREVWHMLHRLSPRRRLAFLKFCCSQVPQGEGKLPIPVVSAKMAQNLDRAYRNDSEDEKVTNEVYFDLLGLFQGWELDAMKTALTLREWVRQYERS